MMPQATKLIASLAICFSVITIVSVQANDDQHSVLMRTEVAKPVLQGPAAPSVVVTSEAQESVVLTAPGAPMMPSSAVMPATGCCDVCCRPCTKRRRRCCPPPVPTNFCLIDPCGCPHEACIEVPACCCGEQPCIEWRQGVVGRQIATLCWDCCGFEAKVVVTRNGKVRVRD